MLRSRTGLSSNAIPPSPAGPPLRYHFQSPTLTRGQRSPPERTRPFIEWKIRKQITSPMTGAAMTLTLLSCGSSETQGDAGPDDKETENGGDGDSDSDADSDGDADSESDGDSDGDTNRKGGRRCRWGREQHTLSSTPCRGLRPRVPAGLTHKHSVQSQFSCHCSPRGTFQVQ